MGFITGFGLFRWRLEIRSYKWMASRGFVAAWALLAGGFALAQVSQPKVAQGATVPSRLLVMYRTAATPPELAQQVSLGGGRIVSRLDKMGIAIVEAPAGSAELLRQQLAARPEVAYVVHDVVLHGETLRVRPFVADAGATMLPDSDYTASSQEWAVKQVGGFGARIPGGPAAGPWNASMGQGVTIAVLDSGVDQTHPDISPNLISATSLIEQTALPSPCDDGTPQDQAGHGTWAASLAMAAMGPKTGLMVGVAPRASLVSIKVLERVPAAGSGTTAQLCSEGTTQGLMSWLLAGISAASQANANIISISAGGLLDTYSGESAGLISMFNRAAYTATQNGALVIAALGNDGESLDNSRYMEMPAQAEDVLPVMAVTNPACAQNTAANATCVPGAVSLAYYSNYGSTLQAVAAPGGSYPLGSATGVTGFVRGACSMGLPGNAGSYGCFNVGHAQYVEAMGTSASAPLVAGVAALVMGAQPSLTPAQVANILRTTASLAVAGLPQVSAAAAVRAPE